MPWQSRHRNRRNRANLIIAAIACLAAFSVIVSANFVNITWLFSLFLGGG